MCSYSQASVETNVHQHVYENLVQTRPCIHVYPCTVQIMNMSGVSIGVGLSTGAETLFTQVTFLCIHTGSSPRSYLLIWYTCILQTFGYKNYKRVGTVLQRGMAHTHHCANSWLCIILLNYAFARRDSNTGRCVAATVRHLAEFPVSSAATPAVTLCGKVRTVQREPSSKYTAIDT